MQQQQKTKKKSVVFDVENQTMMLGNAANRGPAIRGWLINKITLL